MHALDTKLPWKKISEKKRTALAILIREKALAIGVGIVHEQDIDRSNILQATFEAMRRAVAGLSEKPEEVQVDGNFTIPELLNVIFVCFHVCYLL